MRTMITVPGRDGLGLGRARVGQVRDLREMNTDRSARWIGPGRS
jgi:hypothetical protein